MEDGNGFVSFWYRSSMKRKNTSVRKTFDVANGRGIVSGERISLKRSVSERYRITLVTAVRDIFFCVYFNFIFDDGSRLVGLDKRA